MAPDVSTYVVSTQYEYSSDSPLIEVRENTYTFNMVDGSMVSDQVVYGNGTSAVQGSTVFDFRQVVGKYVQLEYQEDQSGNVMSSTETTFDQRGAPNRTTIFSPQGAELASSVTHYDNWGNVNFTQDYDGHDTYFAYANTKDQYQFGNGKTGLIQNFYTQLDHRQAHPRRPSRLRGVPERRELEDAHRDVLPLRQQRGAEAGPALQPVPGRDDLADDLLHLRPSPTCRRRRTHCTTRRATRTPPPTTGPT